MNNKPLIGILLGDATGVGPELIAKLIASGKAQEKSLSVVIGDVRVLRQGMEFAGVDFPMNVVNALEECTFGDVIDVWDQHNCSPDDYTVGQVCVCAAKAAMETRIMCLDLCAAGKLDGLMIAPINKEGMKKAGYMYEDGIRLAKAHLNIKERCGEINIIDGLWTTRVTSHIPLRDVCDTLTVDNIYETIKFAYDCMTKSGYKAPRIGVTGLNPHNGENGLCGDEEITKIAPAIERARAEGMIVDGPFPSDTVFVKAFNDHNFDIIVTMYHDQGQIAMKMKNFYDIATLQGGLPFPVATPAHGTSYSRAGKGPANTGSTFSTYDSVCAIAARKYESK